MNFNPQTFTFLGTGTSQGVPVIGCDCAVCTSIDPKDNRLRTSALLQFGDHTLCFDAGPDFRQQMLRANVRTLDAVVFTHPHKDHIAGLDDTRAFIFRQRKPMQLFANELTLTGLKREYAYAFSATPFKGAPVFEVNEIDTAAFQVEGITLQPIPVMHGQMPVLGFRIGDFAYVTDANFIGPESMALLKGVKTLVLNALRHKPHYSHFTLDEALEVVAELKPQATWLTHISHLLGLHPEVESELPEGVRIAYDGLKIEINSPTH